MWDFLSHQPDGGSIMNRWTRNAGLVLMPALLLSVALLGCSGDKKKPGDGKKGDETTKGGGDGVAGGMKPVKGGKNGISGVGKLRKEDPPCKDLNTELKKKIDAKPEHKAACAKAYEQTLWLVDKDRGVQNVAVWLMPEKEGEFFDVKELAEKKKGFEPVVALDQPHCHFEPRVLVLFPGYIDPAKPGTEDEPNYVRTPQKVYVVNPMTIQHNTKFLARAQGAGQDMSKVIEHSTKDKPEEKGTDITKETKLHPYDPTKGPIQIACDIHSWMA